MFNLTSLRIKRSPQLILASLVMLICGLVVLHHTALPGYLYVGMSITGLLAAIHFIAKHGVTLLPSSIVRCDATEEQLILTRKNGQRIKARPLSSSYLSPRLLLLAWKPLNDNGTWRSRLMRDKLTPAHLTIFTTDNVSSLEDFRRLRVLLTFGKINKPKTTTEPSST